MVLSLAISFIFENWSPWLSLYEDGNMYSYLTLPSRKSGWCTRFSVPCSILASALWSRLGWESVMGPLLPSELHSWVGIEALVPQAVVQRSNLYTTWTLPLPLLSILFFIHLILFLMTPLDLYSHQESDGGIRPLRLKSLGFGGGVYLSSTSVTPSQLVCRHGQGEVIGT